MTSTPTQLLLSFLLPFGVALVIGAGNYLLVRLAYAKVPDFEEGSSLPAALLVLFFVFPAAVYACFAFLPMVLLFPLSLVAAHADRAISQEHDTFLWHYWRTCVGVVASLVDALILYLVLSRSGAAGFINGSVALGCLAGFLAGPVVAPIWIWVYRSLNAFFDHRSARSRHFEF